MKDGFPGEPDIEFSSEPALAAVEWKDFYDPESSIDHYLVSYLRKHAS